jgi:hypothetical protein
LIGLAVFVPIFAVIVFWRPTSHITFLDLHIVNDTHETVTVQPCWDLDCLDIHGLRAEVLRPGGSVLATNQWPTDVGGEIATGIRKPGSNPRKFYGCIYTGAAPGQQTAIARVSHAHACFTSHEP